MIALLVAALRMASAGDLSVTDYLKQVQSGSPSVRASVLSNEANNLKRGEADLLFVPTLGANASYTDDRRNTLLPSFYGTQTTTGAAGINISQLTPWGMTAKLGYSYSGVSVVGVPSYSTYFSSQPQLDLTQPVWANGFGRTARASHDALEAGYLASAYTEAFKTKNLLIGAEITYWRLAFARRIVKIQEEVLARAVSLYEWSARRTKMNLADRSDMLQSQAVLQLRQLELKNAKDEERAASLAFNSQRNIEGASVSEQLSIPSPEVIKALRPILREASAAPREDVLAAREGERASLSAATQGLEKNKPSLDLNLSLAANGLDFSSAGTAISQSLGFTKPYITFGLKFTMPLAFGTASDVRQGYELAKASSGYTSQKTFFDSEQEWRDLNASFVEAKERLDLAHELSKLQHEKLEHERDRLRRGRSTTYQVIQFEQDSSQSDLSLVRATSDLVRIYAQMKTFGRGQNP